MLPRLRHRAVVRPYHQDRAVHLRRARDHVLDIVRVARTVHVSVMTLLRLVLDVRDRYRNAALSFFRRLVDRVELHHLSLALLRQNFRDRARQRRLAMIHVTYRADVHVRLRPLKFRLGHRLSPCIHAGGSMPMRPRSTSCAVAPFHSNLYELPVRSMIWFAILAGTSS